MLILCMLLFVFGGMNVWGVTNGDSFTRISAVGDLADGDEIIFVNQAETYACGTTQNTNNRTPVAITISSHSYTYNSTNNVQVFVVKKSGNNYGFHTGSGYIYSAHSSKNHLATNSTASSTAPSGTAAWTLSVSNNVFSITNVSNTSYYLAFNGTSYFSQYSTGQSKPYIYKKASGYSITYHCNSATSGCPSNASGQTALPNPLPTPTRTGCTFAGWYTNEGLTSAATAGATLSANANLYAKWTTNVTLNRNGATETINNVVVGTALDDIDETGAQGGCSEWTFVGWSKTQRAAQNVSTEMTLVTEVDGSGPYYAVYQHSEGGNGSRTLNIADLASENSWGNGVRQSPITLAPVTMTSNTSGDNGKYYSTDNSWRFYSSTTPKGTVTISIEGGSVTSVVSTPSVTFTISNGVATHTVSSNTKFTKFVVNYSAIVNYYSTKASCCTALAQVEGSANLSQWNAGVHIY